ncbi:MAG: hypothetical protein GTO49_04595 [Anaerolineae bacterium]|nr:hypothetical protein [Anaerolineae bacterium]
MARILAVTGMHRSGTSMVADYLRQCGIDMGETLWPADVGNPRGYHEDVDFLRFHQELLASLGLSTFPTNDMHVPGQIPDDFLLKAREILRKKMQRPLWGWKDCRTSLFLEFWQGMIPQMNALFLFRHPISVVDSLLRRGTDPSITQHPVLGFESWWLHNQRILRFYRTNEERCFLVDIDDLVRSPTMAFRRLFSKLNIDLLAQDFGTVYEPAAFKQGKSARHIYLMLRYPLHTLRCLRLYHGMRELADWP